MIIFKQQVQSFVLPEKDQNNEGQTSGFCEEPLNAASMVGV